MTLLARAMPVDRHPREPGHPRHPRPPRRHGRSTHGAVLTLAAVLALLTPRWGHAQPTTTPDQDRGRRAAKLGLDAEPTTIPSFGFLMHPPKGALVTLERIGQDGRGHVVVRLTDGRAAPSWSLAVQEMNSALENPSPGTLVKRMLDTWEAARRQFSIVTNDVFEHSQPPGRLCYVRQDRPTGERVIDGWLILPRGGPDFLVITIQMLEDSFTSNQALLERAFSTIELRNINDLAADRDARVEAGRAFLETLTPERLHTLIGKRQWLRYYRPPTGKGTSETELGFIYVEFIEAMRGAIEPSRQERKYDPSDQQYGLMARVRGKLFDADSGATIDTISFSWLAWDLSEERWSIRVTTRHGQKELSESQTGIRTAGRPPRNQGSITVVDLGKGGSTRDPKNWSTPDPYLSQPLRWGLGYLLPQNTPVTLSYYFFDGASSQLSLRLDEWEPAPEPPGNGRLISRPRSGGKKVVSVFSPSGAVVRRAFPDGSVAEAIELEALQRLYRTRGIGVNAIPR